MIAAMIAAMIVAMIVAMMAAPKTDRCARAEAALARNLRVFAPKTNACASCNFMSVSSLRVPLPPDAYYPRPLPRGRANATTAAF